MAAGKDSGPENWKYKYLEALEDLEYKERDWQEADKILRRGLGRIALISVGMDGQLDEKLRDLRHGLQKGFKAEELNETIEDIAECVKALDEKRDGKASFFEPADVLRQVVERVGFPEEVFFHLNELKRKLDEPSASDELDGLIEEFGQLVVEAFNDKGMSSLTADDASEGLVEVDDMSVEQVFDKMLESIAFPSDFSDRVEHLKEQLSVKLTPVAIKTMESSIVSLVTEMRVQLESEKEELEKFLVQLTRRLIELDTMVEGAESNRVASLMGGRQLGAMVKAQVNDIESTVRGAGELDQVKSAIQVSLDKIREHLAEQHEQEERRQDELEGQLRTLTQRLHELEGESEHLREKLEQERQKATTDALTGAPNRLAYEIHAAQEHARWKRYKRPLAMLVLDVDHFKKVNDTYGHRAGDRALMAIVKTIQFYLREADFLARIGGEEFVVLLPETSLEDAKKAAEKLRVNIEKSSFVFQGQPVSISVSGGLSEFRPGDEVETVYQRVDEALYRAKREGRNRIIAAD